MLFPLNNRSTNKNNNALRRSGKIAFLFLTWLVMSWHANNVSAQQFPRQSFQNNLPTSQYLQYHKSPPDENETERNYLADDILQYSPVIAVYALNAIGIEGKHRFLERTVYLAGSYVIMGTSVYGLKTLIDAPRPDGSDNNSFPSGHTAIAFMGAEFFRKEFGERSVWYGLAGYTLATTTALLRLHHNKHRPIDVAAGAIIGVLSSQASYLLVPWISHKLFPSLSHRIFSAQLSPSISLKETGMVLLLRF